MTTDYSPYTAYEYMVLAAADIATQLEIRAEDIGGRHTASGRHVFEIGGGPGDSDGEPRRLRITPRFGERDAGAAITAYAQVDGTKLVELWRLEVAAALPEDVWTKALEAAIYALEVPDGAWAHTAVPATAPAEPDTERTPTP